jgi:hypothetical protein
VASYPRQLRAFRRALQALVREAGEVLELVDGVSMRK